MSEENQTIELAQTLRDWLENNYDDAGTLPDKVPVTIAGQAGSGRKYYRLEWAGRTFVLQQNVVIDKEWQRFVEYSQVFQRYELPIPSLYVSDEPSMQNLLEDLGPQQLWDAAQCQSWSEVESLYRTTLAELTNWQLVSTDIYKDSPELSFRDFGKRAIRWETRYFSEHFLQGLCSWSLEQVAELEGWFDELSLSVSRHPRGLMHRDFQSQNIMIKSDGGIAFIDFQGAREGSLYYDAASLLFDPYVELSADKRESLFEFWVSNHPQLSTLEAEVSRGAFLQCALQRLMQALGAYCNLSKNMGRDNFKKYIPVGCRQLLSVLEQTGTMMPEDIRTSLSLVLKKSLIKT